MARKNNEQLYDVRPGGLTEESDIRVLICFLLRALNTGLTRDQMDIIIWDDDRVSYFGYVAALDALVGNGMLKLEEGVYTVTAAGIEAADVLESTLPRAVRDGVLARAVAVLHRQNLQSENETEVVENDDGVSVVCRSRDEQREVLRLQLAADNRDIAQALASQFMKQPKAVYRAAFYALTDDWEGLQDVAEELRRQAEQRRKQGDLSV